MFPLGQNLSNLIRGVNSEKTNTIWFMCPCSSCMIESFSFSPSDDRFELWSIKASSQTIRCGQVTGTWELCGMLPWIRYFMNQMLEFCLHMSKRYMFWSRHQWNQACTTFDLFKHEECLSAVNVYSMQMEFLQRWLPGNKQECIGYGGWGLWGLEMPS